MFYEVSYKVLGYTHTARLENGVTIDAYDDGTAVGDDGNRYRVVDHLDENEEVVVDGWRLIDDE